jgi:hypothetical protein
MRADAMTRIERDLKRLGGVQRVLMTGGNHYKLLLSNGAFVFCGLTPSDRHAMKRVAAQVRRSLRQERRKWP